MQIDGTLLIITLSRMQKTTESRSLLAADKTSHELLLLTPEIRRVVFIIELE